MSKAVLTLNGIFSVLFAVNIFGNALVILIILRYHAMKTPMNYLLLNLAVADIMVGTFFAPNFLFVPFFTHPGGRAGDILCKTITGLNLSWVASLVSAFTLVCVAVERFYAVVHPTSFHHKITTRKLKRIVPACWFMASVHTIPSFISSSYDPEKKMCLEVHTEGWHYYTYWFLWLLDAGIIPVCLMAILYAKILHSLWLQKNNGTAHAAINARKRITKKSITVSVFYALCVFPIHVLYFVSVFHPDLFSQNDMYFKISYILLVLNSSVNPFVYTLQCSKFRKYLKRLIRRRNQDGRQEAVEVSSYRSDNSSLHHGRRSEVQMNSLM